MAGFIYLWENGSKVDSHNVDDLTGLGYAFPAGCACVEINGNNLTGNPGWVIGDPEAIPAGCNLGMYADQQTWEPMPNTGPAKLWLGYWNEHKPTPDDLRRETDCKCARVKLDDGQWWDVPIVGHRDETEFVSDLPAYVALDADGKRVRGKTPERYRELWETVSAIADKHYLARIETDDPAPEVTDDEQWEASVACLAETYRVRDSELVALNVFLENSESHANIWMMASAYDWFMSVLAAAQKKTAPDSTPAGASTSAGEAA